MKKNLVNLLSGTFLASSIIFSGACKKEPEPVDTSVGGCTDMDSPLYNASADYDDNSCQYAYVTQYEITFHQETDGGSDWDLLLNTDADLILRVKESGASSWMFESATIDNQPHNVAATWTAPANIKLLNKDYEWELYDYDDTSGDDFIASGTFNPIELASGGEVIATNTSANTQIKLYYNLAD